MERCGRGILRDGMTDSELLHYAAEFRFAVIGDGASSRMCAAISDPLCAALAVLGVPAQVMETVLEDCNHVFLQLPDGRVLDPTADQFNSAGSPPLPAVYLGDVTRNHTNATVRPEAAVWAPLLLEFKRFVPRYSAREVGGMVRMALATLPPEMCELPGHTASTPGVRPLLPST